MNLSFQTTSQAYLYALEEVWGNPQYKCAPRGLPIHEITDFMFKVREPDSKPIITKDEERNKVIVEYTAKEMDLYNSCSNRVEDFAKASKFWEKIANSDGTINSAYGYLIYKNKSCGNIFEGEAVPIEEVRKDPSCLDHIWRTPYEWVLDSLKQDKDTRQAVMKFSLPEHHWKGNLDFTCTLHANFLIRNNKLNMSVVMRSNDLCKGLVYDICFFVSIMEKLHGDLISTYPNLKIGSYTHLAHSLHAYEKDFPLIKKMLGITDVDSNS